MTGLLFLYKAGRRGEPSRPEGPDEFFYGASGLARRGYAVTALDSAEAARLAGVPDDVTPAGAVWCLARRPLAALLPGFPTIVASHLSQPAVRARLAAADVVVATTTGLAYAAAELRARGGFAGRLIVIAMGIFADTQPQRQRLLFARLLRQATLLAISRAEADFLRARLPGHTDIHYIPFGIDATFWTPAAAGTPPAARPYVLAIGNDLQRDWATLVAAWTPEMPLLRIVTQLPLPPLPANVEAIRGGWHEAALSDSQVRDLYRGAALVVLPIRQTIQPSGQSACLQAMACGKAVVLSDIDGLWDRTQMRDGHACWLVPPGDAAALGARVRAALADPDACAALGAGARGIVESHFTSDRMGEAFAAVLDRRAAA